MNTRAIKYIQLTEINPRMKLLLVVTIESEFCFGDIPNRETYNDQAYNSPREWHHEGPIQVPPDTSQSSRQNSTEEFKRGPQLGPQHAVKCRSIVDLMQNWPVWVFLVQNDLKPTPMLHTEK